MAAPVRTAPVVPVAADAARPDRPRLLPEHWPVVGFFVGYPVLWALGLGLALPLLGIPLALRLLRRRSVRVYRGFGLWLLLLAWMVLSATRLEELSHYLAFAYRFALWTSALTLLVYVADTPRRRLPDATILRAVVFLWGATIVGGYVGVFFGGHRLWTPAQLFVPGSLRSIDFIRDAVAPQLAQVQVFLGYPLARPAAPYTYTNAWGASLALLFPVVAAVWPTLRGRRRTVVGLLAIASIVPMAISANRGLWVTLILVGVYVAVRASQRRDPRVARRLVLGGAALVVLVLVTPLGSIVEDRLETDHSSNTRLTIYAQVRDDVADSPWLGYGSPRSNEENPLKPPVGTHGTFWMVLFSHGIPGALLFVAAMGTLVLRTSRPRQRRYLWLHGVVFGALVMSPFYEVLPVPIYTVAVCAALVLRDRWEAPEELPA